MKDNIAATESDILNEAMEEIKETVKYTRRANEPNDSLSPVIERCGKYLEALIECHEYQVRPATAEEAQVTQKALVENWNFENEDFHWSTAESRKSYSHINDHFKMRKFQPRYAMYGLSNKPKIVALLPYLLFAFYNNCEIDGGCPADIFSVCDSHEKTIGNQSRIITKFSKRFSVESYITDFLKQKRSQYPNAIKKLKTHEDFVEFLSLPQRIGRSKKLQNYHLTDLHYQSILNALVYSTCVLACLHTSTNDIYSQVDYRASFELFNKHTAAFQTVYLAPSLFNLDDDDDDDDDIEQWNFTIYDSFSDISSWQASIEVFCKIVSNFPQQEKNLFQNCFGINICDLQGPPFWADYPSKEWYINAAIITAARFNPFCYRYLIP